MEDICKICDFMGILSCDYDMLRRYLSRSRVPVDCPRGYAYKVRGR